MKQPELGKKISELRSSRGITQEELVEKCKISVRTIQRIEAGEVTPRSYTLKTILAALDADFSKFEKEETEKDSSLTKFQRFSKKLKTFLLLEISKEVDSTFYISKLNLAWLFGIIFFLAGIFEGAADYYLFEEDRMIFNEFVYTLIKLVSMVSFFYFQRGFIIIGKLFSNYLLEIISWLLIVAIVMLNTYDIVSLFYNPIETDFVNGASLIIFGFMGIIFGVSLTRLHKEFGLAAKLAGVLELIAGFLFLTVLFAFIGIFFIIPAVLIEIIIIFKAIELIKNSKSE